ELEYITTMKTDYRYFEKAPITIDGGEDYPAVERDAEKEVDTPMVAELKKQLAKIGRMPEIHVPVNVDRPAEMMSSSFSSHFSADPESKCVDDLCRDFSFQCRNNNAGDMQQASQCVLKKVQSWESLPWPAVERICYNLFHPENCSDLDNLAQVSTHYFAGVNTFMNRAGNKPGVGYVLLRNSRVGLAATIHLIPSNLRFYGLVDLGSDRILRRGRSDAPVLHVKMNGTYDPLFEKVSDLFSSFIRRVAIDGNHLHPDYFEVFAQLLSGSIIGNLKLTCCRVDDTTASSIIEIASRAREISLVRDICWKLSDPAAFITQLDSLAISSIRIVHRMYTFIPFAGLPHSFWKKFFNERLSSGQVEYVDVKYNDMDYLTTDAIRIKEAPITLHADIESLKWKKVETE
ncbi:hypothetical protein PMAYCL1PPCAC_20887, partial [Pristionchus mayeri]